MTHASHILRLGLLGILAAVAFLFFAPEASAAPLADVDAATAIFGPTIANVPWEYVPDWYKAELATSGYVVPMLSTPEGYDPVTAVFGPTIANVPWEYVPAWYKAELAASGYLVGGTGMVSEVTREQEVSETQTVGKESAERIGAAVNLEALDAEAWGDQTASLQNAAEARSSLISETGFFFLGVALIFLALLTVSFLRTRREQGTA
jgi:hypothetical protein